MISLFRNHADSFCHVYDMSEKSRDLEFFFSGIVNEYMTDGEYAVANFNAFMTLIFTTVLRLYPDAFPAAFSSFNDEIFALQQYLEEHYNEEIHISDLVNNYFISPHHLSRCFKQQTGDSPKQYLTNVRLTKAKNLLIKTSLPITVIANQCGFNDVNNFIRLFRKRENITPDKFRKQLS